MTFAGFALTETLFNLYASCIARLIRLETLLGCFDSKRFDAIDNGGSLLSPALAELPVRRPTSARFFLGLYILLVGVYVALLALKW